jgi:hypothetical protein
MPRESIDPTKLPEITTRFVHDWIFLFGIDDPVLTEPVGIIRSGAHYGQAAERLEGWFRDRLTIDPGVPAPFTDLGSSLIGTMLDLVDWEAIVGAMRRRED